MHPIFWLLTSCMTIWFYTVEPQKGQQFLYNMISFKLLFDFIQVSEDFSETSKSCFRTSKELFNFTLSLRVGYCVDIE